MKIRILRLGKDEITEPMIEIDGEPYTLLELMKIILELEVITVEAVPIEP